ACGGPRRCRRTPRRSGSSRARLCAARPGRARRRSGGAGTPAPARPRPPAGSASVPCSRPDARRACPPRPGGSRRGPRRGRAGPAHLVDDLAPAHRHEELQELFGRVEVELSQGGADEEAGENRLADVHRVEQPLQVGRPQPDAGHAPDGGLVAAHQLRRRPVVAGPHALDEVPDARFVCHRPPRRRYPGAVGVCCSRRPESEPGSPGGPVRLAASAADRIRTSSSSSAVRGWLTLGGRVPRRLWASLIRARVSSLWGVPAGPSAEPRAGGAAGAGGLHAMASCPPTRGARAAASPPLPPFGELGHLPLAARTRSRTRAIDDRWEWRTNTATPSRGNGGTAPLRGGPSMSAADWIGVPVLGNLPPEQAALKLREAGEAGDAEAVERAAGAAAKGMFPVSWWPF